MTKFYNQSLAWRDPYGGITFFEEHRTLFQQMKDHRSYEIYSWIVMNKKTIPLPSDVEYITAIIFHLLNMLFRNSNTVEPVLSGHAPSGKWQVAA